MKRFAPAAFAARNARKTPSRRNDELVRILDHAPRKRRRQMRDVAASRHGLGPAGVVGEVRREELEPRIVDHQQLPDVAFLRKVADRRVHRPSLGRERADGKAREVAAAA